MPRKRHYDERFEWREILNLIDSDAAVIDKAGFDLPRSGTECACCTPRQSELRKVAVCKRRIGHAFEPPCGFQNAVGCRSQIPVTLSPVCAFGEPDALSFRKAPRNLRHGRAYQVRVHLPIQRVDVAGPQAQRSLMIEKIAPELGAWFSSLDLLYLAPQQLRYECRIGEDCERSRLRTNLSK